MKAAPPPLLDQPDPFLRVAELLDPQVARSEWYEPNPDPLVTDPERLYFHRQSGLTLVWGRARPNQRPPEGDWFTWMALTGRGWGKTRTFSEWFNRRAYQQKTRADMLLAGRTPGDVNNFALYGPGGLLTHHPEVRYVSSDRLLIWPNGIRAVLRSGANPEEFRGFSGETAWLDELFAWDYPQECHDNLEYGAREGDVRIGISSTPRPLKLTKELAGRSSTVVARGSSYENEANLSRHWKEEVLDKKAGTRLGRQETEGEILEDMEGALWTLSLIDTQRVHRDAVPPLLKIVVGVDPQGTVAEGHETGIVVAGIAADGHVYVLEDASLNAKPAAWGRAAVGCYQAHKANWIVGEVNFGGDMVEQTVRVVDKAVAYFPVSASRGKIRRAEPVSTLYERGLAHHVGAFVKLEDEMCSYTGAAVEASPNRLDALVWAITQLIGEQPKVQTSATWGYP